MSNRRFAAALAVALATTMTACSAATAPRSEPPAESAVTPNGITVPTDSGGVRVPSGTGGTAGSGAGTTGAGEKEKQRGNTPPGMSRDGAGPAGGAIVDPAGAMGGKR